MTMSYIQNSVNSDLDRMLEDACEGLQLTSTQQKLAKSHYEAVCDCLAEEDSPLHAMNPKLKYQGSQKQGTMVKPKGKDEFDIDIVCLLTPVYNTHHSPKAIYDLVARRLVDNGRYEGKLHFEPRCITLKYAGNFCLDILTALPSGRLSPNSIVIPDRQMDNWVFSNPFDFAEWFIKSSKCLSPEKMQRYMAERKDIEPLTYDNGVYPLQRAVQLLKRRRDIYYENRSDRPNSMLLTTLAGYHYQGDVVTTDALINILNSIDDQLKREGYSASVPNPSDLSEDLMEDWSSKQRSEFGMFIADFSERMNHLLTQHGIHNIQNSLQELFGETVANDVILKYGRRLQEQREAGSLGIGKFPAIITGAAAQVAEHKVQRNTFFGSNN